jgi:ATP-dependent protease HslVU (ClpYQ) peptidase subunit
LTTVAYRDGVLAADSLATRHDVRIGSIAKLQRLPNGDRLALLGSVGEAMSLRGWYVKATVDGRADDPGEVPASSNSALVVVKASGALLVFEDGNCHPAPDSPFHAWGSGEALALGALSMGASAAQAVAVAIERDVFSGGDVQVLEAD